MRHIKKIVPVSTLVILVLCLFGILFVIFERDIYKWRASLVVPKPDRLLSLDEFIQKELNGLAPHGQITANA